MTENGRDLIFSCESTELWLGTHFLRVLVTKGAWMEIQIERQVLTFQPLHFVALADRLLVTIETPILNENRTDLQAC